MAISLGSDGSFGHVMKIFIGDGFPCMGFPGYIVCLYVVACYNVYFSLIIMLMMIIGVAMCVCCGKYCMSRVERKWSA